MSTDKPYVTDEQINDIRSRHDHALSVKASAYEVRDLYEAHLSDLRRERDNLRNFIESVIESECWGRVEYLDGGSVQDEAERMGILVQVPHELPCSKEVCGCEGEGVDCLYYFHWRLSTLNTTTDGQ